MCRTWQKIANRRRLSVVSAGLLSATLVFPGCGKPPVKPVESTNAAATTTTETAAAPHASAASTPAAATSKSAGWPAGDDPAAAVEGLKGQIQKSFDGYEAVEKLIYPEGWTKRRYPLETLTVDIVESDADGRPKKLLAKLKYQKVSSIIHPTEEAAKADTDLIPYPAAADKATMIEDKLMRKWSPTETELTYELQDGRWHRTGFESSVQFREGPDWLDTLGTP